MDINSTMTAVGPLLTLSENVALGVEAEGSAAAFYINQSCVGEPGCQLEISEGSCVMTLVYLTPEALDRLSTFFAKAAQQLRYYTREDQE